MMGNQKRKMKRYIEKKKDNETIKKQIKRKNQKIKKVRIGIRGGKNK